MRVLILGGNGMLGHKLCQRFRNVFDTWSTVRGEGSTKVIGLVTAGNFASVRGAVDRVRPDVVVNCIGVIKQLTPDAINLISINSLFPHELAKLCSYYSARLIHISTDCVFSGSKGNYVEDDVADGTDLYGRTKYLGEVGGPHLTIRTSIIGREIVSSNGLLEWFLSKQGGVVSGYTKAIFSGFTTLALAEIIAHIIAVHPQLSGGYHVSADPISKYDLLELINDVYDVNIQVLPDDRLICDRSLDSSRFHAATKLWPHPWTRMIEEMYHDEV